MLTKRINLLVEISNCWALRFFPEINIHPNVNLFVCGLCVSQIELIEKEYIREQKAAQEEYEVSLRGNSHADW